MNKSQLQLIGKLIGIFVLFAVALIFFELAVQIFNAGGGDWGDPIYYGKRDLLLHDEIRTNYLFGFIAAALIAAELWWVNRLTRKQTKQTRLIVLIALLLLSLLIAAKYGPTVFMPIDVGQ